MYLSIFSTNLRLCIKRMDWNKAFLETNFNFEDNDIRIEKTVKSLTKVCDNAL